jgi:hypothetical protein
MRTVDMAVALSSDALLLRLKQQQFRTRVDWKTDLVFMIMARPEKTVKPLACHAGTATPLSFGDRDAAYSPFQRGRTSFDGPLDGTIC